MPDLVTHLAAGYIIGKLAKLPSRLLAVFLLGAILPDIISRPFYLLNINLFWLFEPLHSPIVLILVCIFTSFLFQEKERKAALKYLLLGTALHLAMDLFQRQLVGGYMWLFPFSFQSFSIGLFWPEESIYFIPFLLAGCIAAWLWGRKHKGMA